ncbi:MAG TPA: RsmD family RNA methyltransferase [Candidatus Limnocylindrales bacterium]|nr:RsmD family RNA methyltransferase [Candidatus Limnocylindrales bacterium]
MPEAGRVIAGAARGLRLTGPGGATRPLGDRVKEVLFGSLEGGGLGPWPVAFLDLFAGSGAAGVEALSRGAPRATFVERGPAALAAIRANLERLGPDLASLARIEAAEVLAFLEVGSARGGGPYGAVLVDPPYGDATLGPALVRLADPAGGWLEAEGVVVAKHFWRSAPVEAMGGLVLVRRRRLGETALSIYRPTAAAGAGAAGS